MCYLGDLGLAEYRFPLVAKPCDKIQNWDKNEIIWHFDSLPGTASSTPEPPSISSSIITTAEVNAS